MDALNNETLIRPFWEGAARGQLLTCFCTLCRTDIWYPKEHCPVCAGAISWRPLNGRASLLSWTVVRRQINGQFDVPYMPAIVIPEDAPEVHLVTCLSLPEGVSPYCDMPLNVRFSELTPLQGKPFVAPVFTA